MVSINEIFHNLDSINEVISEQQVFFQNWLEEKQEEGLTEEEILEEINSAWGESKQPFESIEDAEEWFANIDI